MRKISLRPEDLTVDSFDPLPAPSAPAGTVQGQEDSTAPCWAGTWEGSHCDSTQLQDICTCTGGGVDNTTCDVNLSCGGPETCGCAWTDARYHDTCQYEC